MWIDDTNYELEMHPILSDQEGMNRKNIQDKKGVMIIQKIMDVADQGDITSLCSQNQMKKTVASKIASYSKSFPEWNCGVLPRNSYKKGT